MNDIYYLSQMLQIIKNPNDISLQLKLEKALSASENHTHHLIAESLRSNRLLKRHFRQLDEEEERFKNTFLKSSRYPYPEEDQ